MDGHPRFSAVDLTIVTLPEAVAHRPAVYFGDLAAADRPLVIAAWTAAELLDCVVTPEPHTTVTLHRDGDVSAAVSGARLTWPVTAYPRSADEVILRRMWWHQLGSATTVTTLPDGAPSAKADIIGDELVWNDLSIAVRLTLNADLIGAAPHLWWKNGVARLQGVFATDRFRLPPDRHIAVTDEATGTAATIRAG